MANVLARPHWTDFLGSLFARVTKHERAGLRYDMEHGLEELVIETNEVALHHEPAGGPFVFVAAGDATVFLGGQWMFDPTVMTDKTIDPDEGWPKCVRITRAPSTGHVLSLTIVDAARITCSSIALLMPYLGDSYLINAPLAELPRFLESLGEGPPPRPERLDVDDAATRRGASD